MSRAALLAALCLVGGLAVGPVLANGAPPEPDGYRMEAFLAPVPETVAGARVIDATEAARLHAAGVPFVDVMPRPERPANLPADTLWLDRERRSIPGALYAPNVGYGRLPAGKDAYFRAVLERATGGGRDTPVVIFCRADCWMSWNAAKRAATEYGYTAVAWFPGGTDAWTAAGHGLEAVEAMPAE
ncbi:MAG: PQQ-dependent catabolism-associated CXXCW motif protein [Paracoccaceae bacterium]